MPWSMPTAWCEIDGPWTAAISVPSAATSARSALELPPSTARTAARRPSGALVTPAMVAGPPAARPAAQPAPRARRQPGHLQLRHQLRRQLVDARKFGAAHRAAGRRCPESPPPSGPARCGAGRRSRRRGASAPSTTAASTSAPVRSTGQSTPRACQPTCRYPASRIDRWTRWSVTPAPNGQRNHGRGSTPVASMIAACAAAMSDRQAARAQQRHPGVVVRVVADQVALVGDPPGRLSGTPRPSGPGRRTWPAPRAAGAGPAGAPGRPAPTVDRDARRRT